MRIKEIKHRLGENIAKDIADKGLVSKGYKELSELNKKMNNMI